MVAVAAASAGAANNFYCAGPVNAQGVVVFNSLGVQLRRDRIRVGLYDSAARLITARFRL